MTRLEQLKQRVDRHLANPEFAQQLTVDVRLLAALCELAEYACNNCNRPAKALKVAARIIYQPVSSTELYK